MARPLPGEEALQQLKERTRAALAELPPGPRREVQQAAERLVDDPRAVTERAGGACASDSGRRCCGSSFC